MDEAEPASFIAARGNIEDDESVAGDGPGDVGTLLHSLKKIIIIIYINIMIIKSKIQSSTITGNSMIAQNVMDKMYH